VSRRIRPLHWAGRLARSLRPGGPSRDDRDWAEGWLSGSESDLFARMSNPDRRHAVAVARRVEARLDAIEVDGAPLDPEHRRATMAAALLHDVGKTMAGLGTYGRVVATLSGAVGGRDYAVHWQDTDGFTRKVGLYLRYPELGSEMLQVAGSHPWVVAWAAQHHEPEEVWDLPEAVGRVLVEADDG
jgi:hypothetical protein